MSAVSYPIYHSPAQEWQLHTLERFAERVLRDTIRSTHAWDDTRSWFADTGAPTIAPRADRFGARAHCGHTRWRWENVDAWAARTGHALSRWNDDNEPMVRVATCEACGQEMRRAHRWQLGEQAGLDDERILRGITGSAPLPPSTQWLIDELPYRSRYWAVLHGEDPEAAPVDLATLRTRDGVVPEQPIPVRARAIPGRSMRDTFGRR